MRLFATFGVKQVGAIANYRIVDLGTMGRDLSYATDINDGGQIVGWAYFENGWRAEAFLYENDGTAKTQVINSNTAEVSHTYESAGSYQVWVEVTSANAGNGAAKRVKTSVGVLVDDGCKCFIDCL